MSEATRDESVTSPQLVQVEAFPGRAADHRRPRPERAVRLVARRS